MSTLIEVVTVTRRLNAIVGKYGMLTTPLIEEYVIQNAEGIYDCKTRRQPIPIDGKLFTDLLVDVVSFLNELERLER